MVYKTDQDHLAKGPGGFNSGGFNSGGFNSGFNKSTVEAPQFFDDSAPAHQAAYQGPEPVYANLNAIDSPLYAKTAATPKAPHTGGNWRATTFVAAGVLLAVGLGLNFTQHEAVVLADAPLIMPGELDERVRPEIAGGMFIPDRNMSIMNGKIDADTVAETEMQANLDLLTDDLDDNILVPTPVSFQPDPVQNNDATIGDLLNQLKQGDAWTEGRLLQRRLGLNLANMMKDDTPDPFAEADRELSSRIQTPAAIVETAKQAAIEAEDLANLEAATLMNDFSMDDLSIDMEVASLIPDADIVISNVLPEPTGNVMTSASLVQTDKVAALNLPGFGRSANVEPVNTAVLMQRTMANARVAPTEDLEVQTQAAPETASLKFENKNKLKFNFVSEVAYAEPTTEPDEEFANWAFNPKRMNFFGQTAQADLEENGFDDELGLDVDPLMQFSAAGESNFVPDNRNMLEDPFIDELNNGVEVAQLSLDGQSIQPIFDGGEALPPLVEDVEAEINRLNQGLLNHDLVNQSAQPQMNAQQQAGLQQAQAAAASNERPLDSPFADAPISHRPEVPQGLTAQAVGTPYAIQLASVTSQAKAEKTWQRAQRKFPELLGDMVLGVETVKVKGKTYYRVQAGPIPNRITGSDVCSTLKANRQDCIVAKRK